MAPLCAEFGISRKTGYKIFDRCKTCSVQAFSDQRHRAHRQANRLAPIEATIVQLERECPGWGAPKVREKLRQQFTGPLRSAISTVHAVLDGHRLVHHRRRRRSRDPLQSGAKCRVLNARPEPDFRYRSNRVAARSVAKCSATTRVQGRWLTV